MAVGDSRRLRVVIDGDSRGGRKAFEDIRGSATKTESQVKNFSSKFGSAMGAVATVAKLTAGVAAGLFGLGVIKKGIDRLSTIEDATAALTIALGSATKAGKLMDKVLGVVRGTPFNLDQFATAAKNLVVFGVAADKVPKYLHAMGEAAAASGAGAESVQVLVNAFGDAATIGHITGDTLFTLASQGVPALKILANAYGLTTEDMQKMVAKGMVPATKGMDILTQGIEKGSTGIAGTTVALGGSMESLRKTFRGSFGGMQAALARFGAAIIGPFMGNMTSAMTNISKLMDTAGAKVKEFLTNFVAGLSGKGKLAGFSGTINEIGLGLRALVGAFKEGDVTSDGLVGKFELVGAAARGVIEAFKTGTVTSGGWRAELELIAVVIRKILELQIAWYKILIASIGWLREHESVAKALGVTLFALVAITKAHGAAMAVANSGGLVAMIKSMRILQPILKASAALQWAWNGAIAAAKYTQIAGYLGALVVQQKAIALWSKIVTAAQWLWNVALSANPIGLVVIAIAAFVAAIILLWKNSESFRSWVMGKLWPSIKQAWDQMKAIAKVVADAMVAAWNWIKSTAIAAWTAIVNFLTPIGRAIYVGLKPIIDVVTTIGRIVWIFYSNTWKIVWILVQIAAKLAVAYFQTYIVPLWKIGMVIIGVALRILQGSFQRVWNGIKSVVDVVARWFTGKIIPSWKEAFRQLMVGVNAVKNYFAAQWALISGAVRTAFNLVAGPIAARFNEALSKIRAWLAGFRAGWNIEFDRLKNKVTNFKDGVVKAFNLLKDGVKKAWDLMVDMTKRPINFLIGSVYSDRIVPMWNRVAEKFGIKTRLQTIPRLAKGGTVPGAGNRDTVPAMLTPGEGVLTLREMKILGGPDGFNALRSQINLFGKYANGGVVQKFADGGIAGFFSGLVKKGKDIFQGAAAGLLQPMANAIKGLINRSLGADGFPGLMRAGGHTIVDKFMAWVRGKDKEVPTIGAGAFGSWPSSPSAQRGDSGVWRKILALVKASGISYSFGNAYRPGDPKWHGSGRAIDFMGFNQDRLARFFLTRQSQILEMIHRTGSRDYAYTRGKNKGSFNQSLMNAHRNHLHIAMDGVSQVDPGYFMGYNGTGKKETLVNKDLIGGVTINGGLHLHGVQNIKQLRDELIKLGGRNGGRTGLPAT